MSNVRIDLAHGCAFLSRAIARYRMAAIPLSCRDVVCVFSGSVEHVDRFLEFGHANHTVYAACVAKTNLSHACSNVVERFPVLRIESSLQSPELKTGFTSSSRREAQNVIVRGADPSEYPFHYPLYKILYAMEWKTCHGNLVSLFRSMNTKTPNQDERRVTHNPHRHRNAAGV